MGPGRRSSTGWLTLDGEGRMSQLLPPPPCGYLTIDSCEGACTISTEWLKFEGYVPYHYPAWMMNDQ